jgi:hypothetical protein
VLKQKTALKLDGVDCAKKCKKIKPMMKKRGQCQFLANFRDKKGSFTERRCGKKYPFLAIDSACWWVHHID